MRASPRARRARRTSATQVDQAGATPFLMAADRADVPLMRLLLELGADPFLPNARQQHAADGRGRPRHGGARRRGAAREPEALEAVQLLLDLGADINAVDNNGDTAMHGAAYGNFPTVVQLLADRGAEADIWNRPEQQGRTPLFIAEGYRAGATRRSPPTIEALVRLMDSAGVPTDGERPQMIDIYAPRPAPPKSL